MGDVPGNALESKVTTLADRMAGAIAAPASAAMQRIAASESTANVTTYTNAWGAMFPEGYGIKPVIRNQTGQVVNNSGKSTYYAPVYPVSDERGYEVVGTYPYGRGFSLTDANALGQLLGPTGDLPNYDAVDTFIRKLMSSDGTTASVAKIIGESNLDATTKAELAAGMDPAVLADKSIAEALNAVPGVTGLGPNTPASSAQGIGVFNPVNVAYGLSDMKVANMGSCDCFAHQSDIQLLRDPTTTAGYIVVEGTEDAFAAYIRDVANSAVPGWAAAQENYRGQVIATSEASRPPVATVRDTITAGNAGVRAAVEDLQTATQGIDPVDSGTPAWQTLKTRFTKGQS